MKTTMGYGLLKDHILVLLKLLIFQETNDLKQGLQTLFLEICANVVSSPTVIHLIRQIKVLLSVSHPWSVSALTYSVSTPNRV